MRKFLIVTALVLFLGPASARAFLPAGGRETHRSPNPVEISEPAGPWAGPVQPDPDLVNAILWEPILSSGISEVTFTNDGKRISSLLGNLTDPTEGDPSQLCRDFLLSHKDLFNLPDWKGTDWLAVVRDESVAGATHIGLQMNVDGLPVDGARIDLHVGGDRRIQFVTGSFPVVSPSHKPFTVNRECAISAATLAIGMEGSRKAPTAAKFLFPKAGELLPFWRVELAPEAPLGDFSVDVDATDGTVFRVGNMMTFVSGQSLRFTGVGSIFRHHPLQSKPELAPLFNLATHTLSGNFVLVRNDDGPGAVSNDDRYDFPPENTHFDESNAYFHLDRVHDFFRGLGFTGMDRVARAWVHYGTNVDNAFFSPLEDRIRFGDGSRFNDFAKEEAVIYHEYSHAVLHRIVALEYAQEAGAINEGQADYFACSLSGDPKIGEWVGAKAGMPFLRNLENGLHYPEDCTNEVHDDGRIWGGALWDLRRVLGAGITDRLVHGSHFFLKPGEPWFRDAYQALLVADQNQHGGRNKAVIAEVFRKRGIVQSDRNGKTYSNRDLEGIKRFKAVHGETWKDQ